MQKKTKQIIDFYKRTFERKSAARSFDRFVFFACRYDKRVQRYRYGFFDDVRPRHERIDNIDLPQYDSRRHTPADLHHRHRGFYDDRTAFA